MEVYPIGSIILPITYPTELSQHRLPEDYFVRPLFIGLYRLCSGGKQAAITRECSLSPEAPTFDPRWETPAITNVLVSHLQVIKCLVCIQRSGLIGNTENALVRLEHLQCFLY